MVAPGGGRRSPTRSSLGTASLSISSLLVFSSTARPESPVTLPPGRDKLVTRPSPTGSAEFAITMGIKVVAPFAANTDGADVATMRSTFRRTNSVADQVTVSLLINRYSMVIFFPQSIQACSALPERIREPATGSSAVIEKPMRDFQSAARRRTAKRKEHGAKCEREDSLPTTDH